MALVDRLAGIGTGELVSNISVHTFWAAIYELSKGQVTQQQIINYFDLDAGEQTELNWLVTKYAGLPTDAKKAEFVELMHVLFLLASSNVPGYSTNAELVARINAI